MSTYPGNPSLGDEVKQRILVTYQQSLDLAERGRREEALLGCDFVLELDPQFGPARALRSRLADGAGGAPEPPAAGEPAAGERPEESFEGLFDLDALELPEIEEPAEPAETAETAQARLEAQPYVESFLQKAGAAARSGDVEGATPLLEKARSLDPDHPGIAELERTLSEAASARPAAGAEEAEVLGGYDLPEPTAWEEPPGPAPEPEEEPERSTEPGAEPPAAAEAAPADGSGEGRIGELLGEGQAAADRGDLQGAIDAWSRIFLIDVDHEEAAARIEAARRSKAEREREVEEVFHEGLTALEQGDAETARRRFERVLEVQPHHLAARETLRQMESGEPVQVAARPSPDDTVALGSLGSFDLSDLTAPREDGAAAEELKEEILVPPPPGERPAEEEAAPVELPSYGKAAVGRDTGRRTFLLVGGLVLVLVAGAAALVFLNKDRWFPNSEVEEPAAAAGAAEAPGPIERATDLHERGQTAMALGVLRRIRPDDPRHAEAQELIARWEAPAEPAADEEEVTLAPQALERRGRLIAAAGTAFERGEYLLSDELLDRAAKIAALEGEALELDRSLERELAPLAPEINLFREGEYEMVLPRLWRLRQAEPGNRDVQRMLVNSYYNRGVRQLQRGDPAGAAQELEEALELAPDDEDVRRHYLFAQTYERRPRDLLYRTYVKYLPLR